MNLVAGDAGFILVILLLIGCIVGWILFRYLRVSDEVSRGRGAKPEGFQVDITEGARQRHPLELLAYDMQQAVTISCPPKLPEYMTTALFWDFFNRWQIMTQPDSDKVLPPGKRDIVQDVQNVMFPGEDSTYQVAFPMYMSMFALAIYGETPITRSDCARRLLFNEYDATLKKLTTELYDQNMIAAWNVDPKGASCVSLKVLEDNFRQAKVVLRSRIQDVSGATFTLTKLREENMEFQKRFAETCGKNLTQECRALASQEPILFPLLAQFDGVIETTVDKEEEINETLKTIGDLYTVLGCQAGVDMKFNYQIDTEAGEVDSETLKLSLQTLSPYYLSPDVLNYITEFLIDPEEVQADLMKTSDMFAKINKNVTAIQRVTGASP